MSPTKGEGDSEGNDELKVPSPEQNSAAAHPNSAPATPLPPAWSNPPTQYWRFPDHLSQHPGGFAYGQVPRPYTQGPSSSAYLDPNSQYAYQYPVPDPYYTVIPRKLLVEQPMTDRYCYLDPQSAKCQLFASARTVHLQHSVRRHATEIGPVQQHGKISR